MRIAALFAPKNHSFVTNQAPEDQTDELAGLPQDYFTTNPPLSSEDAMLIPESQQ